MHRPLDVDTAVGRALLAAEAEGGAHDALGRLVQVGLAADDGRVLAAHLDDDGLGEAPARSSCRGRKPTSNEPVKMMPSTPAFSCSSAPTVSPGPMTRLKTPSGTPASRIDLGQADARQRRVGGGLVDDRVAGHERAAGRPAGEGQGEVEGADDRPHAVGLEDRARVHGRVARGCPWGGRSRRCAPPSSHDQRIRSAVSSTSPSASRRFLPTSMRHQRGELHLALADQRRRRGAGWPPAPATAGAPRPGRPARAAAIASWTSRRVPLAKVPMSDAVDRRALLEGALAVALAAVHEVAVVAPQQRRAGRPRPAS